MLQSIKERFYSVDIVALDNDNEIHNLTFTEYITNQEQYNKHINNSIKYVMNEDFSILHMSIENSTEEEIITFLQEDIAEHEAVIRTLLIELIKHS